MASARGIWIITSGLQRGGDAVLAARRAPADQDQGHGQRVRTKGPGAQEIRRADLCLEFADTAIEVGIRSALSGRGRRENESRDREAVQHVEQGPNTGPGWRRIQERRDKAGNADVAGPLSSDLES